MTMTMTILPSLFLLLTSLLGVASMQHSTSDNNKDIIVNNENNNEKKKTNDLICGIWFAKSTIPGAGLGLFAGQDFESGTSVLPIGDVVIPLVDLAIHQADNQNRLFLWDEYTWDGASLYMDHEGVGDELNGASPGFGAGVNCFMDLVNIKETVPESSNLGLHRFSDPGAGAFSTYWNRDSVASQSIAAGNELFASYGSSWFTTRETTMGPVPLKGDLRRGNTVLDKYMTLKKRLLSKYAATINASEQNNDLTPEDSDKATAAITEQNLQEVIFQDLWETFAWNSPWTNTSRVLSALPKTWPETQLAHNISLTALKRQQHSVSVQYLEEHGACGDWITVQPSTIPQAGRGAFSRRPFEIGEDVAPFPLIHLPYRNYLDMFGISSKSGSFVADREAKRRTTQLLENYCMGHKESTMLLCPYGTLSDHVNHNQTQQNVKMIWADPDKSNHQPSWLNRTLRDLYQTDYSGLSMTLVATRPIAEGDELFLDYGNDWEQAWTAHVANWTPVKGAEHYVSAEQLNSNTSIIKTEFELMYASWPGNVDLKMNRAFAQPRRRWIKHLEEGTLQAFVTKEDDYYQRVEVLRRKVDTENRTWYTVIILEDKEEDSKTKQKRIQVPREAFTFFDRPYTSDMHQNNAFRHDIGIPDHLFPQLWKNRVGGNGKGAPPPKDDTATTVNNEPATIMESDSSKDEM